MIGALPEVVNVDQVWPPSVDTWYEVMTDPPLSSGARKATSTEPVPRVTLRFTGALGTVAGVTSDDGSDSGELPASLVAWTVNS